MNLDLDELERKAKAATSGTWATEAQQYGSDTCVESVERGAVAECGLSNDMVPADEERANAVYIAAASPSAVLALIERVRDADAEKAADAERAEYWRVEANRVHAEALAKANERVRELEKKLAEAPDNWENGDPFEKDINA